MSTEKWWRMSREKWWGGAGLIAGSLVYINLILYGIVPSEARLTGLIVLAVSMLAMGLGFRMIGKLINRNPM